MGIYESLDAVPFCCHRATWPSLDLSGRVRLIDGYVHIIKDTLQVTGDPASVCCLHEIPERELQDTIGDARICPNITSRRNYCIYRLQSDVQAFRTSQYNVLESEPFLRRHGTALDFRAQVRVSWACCEPLLNVFLPERICELYIGWPEEQTAL